MDILCTEERYGNSKGERQPCWCITPQFMSLRLFQPQPPFTEQRWIKSVWTSLTDSMLDLIWISPFASWQPRHPKTMVHTAGKGKKHMKLGGSYKKFLWQLKQRDYTKCVPRIAHMVVVGMVAIMLWSAALFSEKRSPFFGPREGPWTGPIQTHKNRESINFSNFLV